MLSKGLNIFILLAFSLLASSPSFAEMKTYDFTKAFIDCVNDHSADGKTLTTKGVAESALMNGTEVIGGAPLGSNYWAYMTCLNKANSGTSSSATTTKQSCPSKLFSIGTEGHKLFIPSGAEGKTVNIKGISFVCTSGIWSREGGGTPDTDLDPLDCDYDASDRVMQIGVCKFNLPATQHNGYATASFDAKNTISLEGFYSGELKAKCVDGVFQAVESSCERQTCQPAEEVEWRGGHSSGHHNKSFASCKGTVDANGFATLLQPETEFYRTEIGARLNTKIPKGEARFYCDEGKWKLPPSFGHDHLGNTFPTPSCSYKTQSELNCFSRKSSSGKTEYACL